MCVCVSVLFVYCHTPWICIQTCKFLIGGERLVDYRDNEKTTLALDHIF